jgi:hypothetical protein
VIGQQQLIGAAPHGPAASRQDADDERAESCSKMLVTAEVAVYTEHWHHVGVMRRVLLRMSSWMNYVFLEH